MSGMERHLFPGNNTPSGFFSYYEYILNQDEGQKIYCLKGGPGVGKSTLIGRIGKRFLEQGEDVDFFHCSADRNSLDAILLKKRNMCPWDYSKARWNIKGVIRLAYAPVWFLTGLLYERVLKRSGE